MKSLFTVTTTAVIMAISSPTTAQEPSNLQSSNFSGLSGYYVSTFAGGAFNGDFEQDLTLLGVNTTTALEFKSGYVLGLAVGAHLGSNLRGEIEYSYSNNDIDNVSISVKGSKAGSIAVNGGIETQFILANLWYDFDYSSDINPYIGGGIGYGDVELSPSTISDGGFAFQVGAGVQFSLTDQLSLDVSYRYKDILGVNFLQGTGLDFEDDNLQSHNVQAAITYEFGY